MQSVYYYLRKENYYNESTVDTGFFLEGFKETKLRVATKWWYV